MGDNVDPELDYGEWHKREQLYVHDGACELYILYVQWEDPPTRARWSTWEEYQSIPRWQKKTIALRACLLLSNGDKVCNEKLAAKRAADLQKDRGFLCVVAT